MRSGRCRRTGPTHRPLCDPASRWRRSGARGARACHRSEAVNASKIVRWREILYMLVLRDLKALTKQAYLGYFWILIQPLLLTGAFSFLVQQVLGREHLSHGPCPAC